MRVKQPSSPDAGGPGIAAPDEMQGKRGCPEAEGSHEPNAEQNEPEQHRDRAAVPTPVSELPDFRLYEENSVSSDDSAQIPRNVSRGTSGAIRNSFYNC